MKWFESGAMALYKIYYIFFGYHFTVDTIAFEKAGIIKPKVPALVGEIYTQSVAQVFADAAHRNETLVYFASQADLLNESYLMDTGEWYFDSVEYGQLFGELGWFESGAMALYKIYYIFFGYHFTVDTDAFTEIDQVGRCEKSDFISRLMKDRCQ